MKYLIVVPDGAADVVVDGERTPLEEANMPAVNGLAKRGRTGLVRTIPRGIAPGSDAANLAVLGYDPAADLTGRSPLEAISMEIDLGPRDVAFRTNLVTLADGAVPYEMGCSPAGRRGRRPLQNGMGADPYEMGWTSPDNSSPYASLTIVDHASGDISTEEARILIECVDKKFGSGDKSNRGRVKFYPGVSYRHALIVRDKEDDMYENSKEEQCLVPNVYEDYTGYALTPPHDILGRQIGLYLPDKENERYILSMMSQSYWLLKDHEINKARIAKGLRPANSIWIWGEGIKPQLAPITEKYGIKGAVISAVDLIKGIGICAGLEPITVEGATGTIETNFRGKGAAAIDAFSGGKDLAYIHVEAPDECAHQGSREGKILSLERIDADVVSPILDWLEINRIETGEEYRVLIVPDHRTPVVIRTHTDEPVPYVFYDSAVAGGEENDKNRFTERAAATGMPVHSGRELADAFFAP